MVKVTMPLGLLAVIPTMALLTASFFVMVVLRKLEEGPLKSFGRIIAAFLCIAAFAVFTIGMYVVSTGNCPLVNMIGKCSIEDRPHKMICEGMHKPMEGKMHKGMHRMK